MNGARALVHGRCANAVECRAESCIPECNALGARTVRTRLDGGGMGWEGRRDFEGVAGHAIRQYSVQMERMQPFYGEYANTNAADGPCEFRARH